MYKKLFILGTCVLLPSSALAATTLFTVMNSVISVLQLAMPIMLACAVAVFFWGVVKFIWHADDEKAVEEGKMYLVWGMVGIFVIVALWSIIGFIQHQLGLDVAGGVGSAPGIPTTIPT